MYQAMSGSIDLYGQEVAELKKIRKLADDLAEKFELPEEALLGAAKLTVTAGHRALVENHCGIIEYGDERIVISTGRGRLSVAGQDMRIIAMNKSELLISGGISTVEWE